MSQSRRPAWLRGEFWLRHARKAVIAVIGGTVLLVGVAMVVLPGPAFVVIPAGLAILATEFAWARYWLKKAQALAQDAANAEAVQHNPAVCWLKEKWARLRGQPR